ncbi:hypothetical protein [Longispora albida]|uniref:hypothetical protein n=1 Tax=Longispora albida TaxID=203523 RepID=UPI0003738A2A|nr:hypothetical protein [Longispora albida]
MRRALILLAASALFAVTGLSLAASRDEPEVLNAQIDNCLRGQWREVSYTAQSAVAGDGPVTLSGAGRTLRFSSGREIMDYGQGVTYTGKTTKHQISVYRTGKVIYSVRLEGGKLHFTGLTADATEKITVDGQQVSSGPIGASSAPLEADCQRTTLTLSEPGHKAVFERLAVKP